MLAKSILSTALLLATALSAAAQGLTAVDITMIDDPYEICADREIDIYGPIPADAIPIQGGYSFDANSDALHWVRAQIALATSSDLEKREWANIGIGMFAQNWCTGQGSWFDNVEYGTHYVDHTNMFAVGISYRGLRDNEHLDFSRLAGSDWCGKYVFSAGRLTPVGCFNCQAINCFELWN
ncbi:hypothetical protein Q9L58_006994 [Maublancomyces gigas]|uniref:Uncharacterized protein n=1 Tax=Discina gigas TaxID=1032678 RepID=A0ABR3GDX8_9PEZI